MFLYNEDFKNLALRREVQDLDVGRVSGRVGVPVGFGGVMADGSARPIQPWQLQKGLVLRWIQNIQHEPK